MAFTRKASVKIAARYGIPELSAVTTKLVAVSGGTSNGSPFDIFKGEFRGVEFDITMVDMECAQVYAHVDEESAWWDDLSTLLGVDF